MSLKRKTFNIFAAVLMIVGSVPVSFLNVYAESQLGDVPESLKSVKANKNADNVGDGTYDITLEIRGVSSNENDATKANVVVVYDTSGSMSMPTTFNTNNTGRYGFVNGGYVNLYQHSFIDGCSRINDDYTGGAVYSDYQCDNRYYGTRYAGASGSSLRIDVASSAVKNLASELLSQNDPSNEDFKDVVEIAFVDFATMVNATEGPTVNYNDFAGWVDDADVKTGGYAGTNWEAALSAANDVSFDDDDKTYIIFVSDGDPTVRNSRYNNSANDCLQSSYGRCVRWGNGHDDPSSWNFDAAKTIANSIVNNANKEFYAVGTFGNATNMRNLGGTYYDATNQDALNNAFADIVDKITKKLSVADLQITDGITTAASAEIKGAAGNFRYNVPHTEENDWGEPGVGFNEATYEDGSVHWNPSLTDGQGNIITHRTLSNGEKASVTFTVWPSQEAMDCIAKIRNEGTCGKTDEELQAFGIAKNADGSFRLLTNSSATFRYKTATKDANTGETEYSVLSRPVEFKEERDPTNLPETTLQVMKKWLDTMGSQRTDVSKVSIDLYVDRSKNPDPKRHYTFEYQKGDEWIGTDETGNDEYTVAPGVMKKLDGTPKTAGLEDIAIKIVTVGGERYAVLESGHDYEFDGEVVDFSGSTNHYHITKREYHPMIVDDGEIHNVIFNDDGTATIEEEPLESLAVENTLNGGILVFKVVENNGELDRTIEDEYEITISNIKDAEGNLLSHTDETPMRYRIMNCSVSEKNGEYEEDCSPADDRKTEFNNGTFTVKIKANQGILVGDLPTGATFEVSETQPEGYGTPSVDYRLVQYDNKGKRVVLDEEDGSGYVQTVYGNSSAQAVVTNTLESGDLIISKEVKATSGDLDQARDKAFSFTINFYKSQGDAEPVRTDTETCAAVKHNETCEIKNIPKGWYYEIIETAKPGFNNGEATTKTGTIKKGDNEVEFVNDYAVTPVDAEIVAYKAFAQGYQQFWIGSDSFEFQLIGDNEIIDSENATLANNGTVKFERNYTKPGTYKYIITEKINNTDGSSAFRQGVHRVTDDADIEVTVEVEDNGKGALVVKSITYKKTDQTIYNIYEDTTTYGANKELEFTKVLEGRAWRSTDEFNFEITGSDGAPMPSKTELTVKDSTKDHTVNFGTIEFDEQDVGNTYVYTVSEDFDVPSVEAKDGKNEIIFTVEVKFNQTRGTLELVVSGHDNTFINVYKTTNVTAAKVWNDGDDRDGLRKNFEGYFVAVKNDEGEFVDYADLALEDKDDYVFTDLPEKNADGEEIEYEIVEASTCSGKEEGAIQCTEYEPEEDDPYTVTVANGVITNFHEPELYNKTGELTVKKIWHDEGHELTRPGSVSVDLLANGKVIDSAEIVKGSNDEWMYTFTDLYLNDGGEPIVYSVQESMLGETEFGENESVIVVLNDDGAIEGSWTKSEDNDKYEVTNTWKPAEPDEIIYEGDNEFTIKKVDKNYKPLSGVIFAVKGHSDKTTDKNGEITITVPISEDEKDESFKYEISEKEAKEGYDKVDGSATVTIDCTSELTDIDTENLINTYTKTCTFSEEGGEVFTWDEDDLILTVVNNRSMAKSLTIQKTVEGLMPEVLTDLEFTIEGPEDFGEDGKMILKVSKDCTIDGKIIACVVSGKVPTGNYTVTESNADVEYFELKISGDNGKEKKVNANERAEFKITNKYEVEKTWYKVVKVWQDEHDKDGIRPTELEVNLLANGEPIQTKKLSAKNETQDDFGEDLEKSDVWEWTFEDLPVADENAEVIEYYAEEILEADGYEQIDEIGGMHTVIFVNMHEPVVDPCEEGGCGGEVPPVKTPETGKLTKSHNNDAVEGAWTGNMIGGAMMVILGISLVAFGKRKEVKLTK